jgi:acyl transferase domain-containing protein
VIGEGGEELLEGLASLAEGRPSPLLVEGVVDTAGGGAPVFVFPGQGGQWAGMALELLDRSPVFAAEIRACAAALEPHLDWELEAVLRGSEGAPALEPVEVVQPALFAVMVSLARLWRSFGVEPSAVVGHSQGEIAAAHVAGGLSLSDAALIVAARSRALATIEGKGGMLALALSPEQFEERARGLGERVTLAAVNGPASVVCSGDPEALEELERSCEADGVRAGRIRVSYASHSPQVEAAREELLSALAGIEPRPSELPLYSTVTGEPADTALMDAEHWFHNLRRTVLFEPAIRGMVQAGIDTLIEVGPHPILLSPASQTLDSIENGGTVATIGSLRRDEGGWERFLTSLAEAHTRGVRIDWESLFAGAGRVALPTYAFQRERYWLPPTPAARDVHAGEVGVHRDGQLFEVDWRALPGTANGQGRRLAVLGDGVPPSAVGPSVERYADLPALIEAIEAGSPAPEEVLTAIEPDQETPLPEAAGATAERALELIKAWLAAEPLAGARLVLTTPSCRRHRSRAWCAPPIRSIPVASPSSTRTAASSTPTSSRPPLPRANRSSRSGTASSWPLGSVLSSPRTRPDPAAHPLMTAPSS